NPEAMRRPPGHWWGRSAGVILILATKGVANVRTLCALRSGLAPARGLRRGARRVRVRAALERGAYAVAAGCAPAAGRRAGDPPVALGAGAVVGEGRGDRHQVDQRAR